MANFGKLVGNEYKEHLGRNRKTVFYQQVICETDNWSTVSWFRSIAILRCDCTGLAFLFIPQTCQSWQMPHGLPTILCTHKFRHCRTRLDLIEDCCAFTNKNVTRYSIQIIWLISRFKPVSCESQLLKWQIFLSDNTMGRYMACLYLVALAIISHTRFRKRSLQFVNSGGISTTCTQVHFLQTLRPLGQMNRSAG